MNVIYFGDGDGGLTDSQQTLFAEFGGYTNDLATADIDHDGDIDLLEGTTLGRHNKIWFNDGLGQFSPGPDEFGAQEVQAIAIGDIDRDGNLDLIAGCAGVGSPFPNVILLGDGNGGFTESFEFPTPDTTTGVALTDVDEDGDLDLVVTNVGDNYLYHNDGLGNYGTPTIIGEDSSYSVEAADFDRDGDVDLLIGNRGSEDKLLRSK